jgi:hypothetical protein
MIQVNPRKVAAPIMVCTQPLPEITQSLITPTAVIGLIYAGNHEVEIDSESLEMQGARNANSVIGVPLGLLRSTPSLSEGNSIAQLPCFLNELRHILRELLLQFTHRYVEAFVLADTGEPGRAGKTPMLSTR